MTKTKDAAAIDTAPETPESPRHQITLDGQTFNLAYDWEAFARFADGVGCTLNNVDAVLDNLPVSSMPVLIWAGLSESAPLVTIQHVQAGLKKMGLKRSMETIAKATKAFQAALNDEPEGEAGDGAEAAASEKKPASR